jgi:metallo-beta-lactamase family protein
MDHVSLSKEFRDFAVKDGDPFGFGTIRYVRSVEESKRLMNTPGRKIIMAGSGMCEGGRILHHLRNLIGFLTRRFSLWGTRPRHLGPAVGGRLEKVKIFGLMHDVAAEVHVLTHLSSHADQEDLSWFIRSLSPRPAQTFLVHGDQTQRDALKEKLKGEGITRVVTPRFGEVFELD